jgi:hypothetical protein
MGASPTKKEDAHGVNSMPMAMLSTKKQQRADSTLTNKHEQGGGVAAREDGGRWLPAACKASTHMGISSFASLTARCVSSATTSVSSNSSSSKVAKPRPLLALLLTLFTFGLSRVVRLAPSSKTVHSLRASRWVVTSSKPFSRRA